MNAALPLVARRIRVTGIVQGVGFRPFVWRLAQELELAGWVRNDAAGVDIAVEGCEDRIARLIARLRDEAPPLARVDAIVPTAASPVGCAGFVIVDSASGRSTTAIGPDVATCPECLAEMCDPDGRRWRHAFITCTHCGPRYTVTRALPYDRPQTSLAPFPLCPACAREYGNPADRRFHAETTCCPACGPRLALHDAQGMPLAADPIAATLGLLRQGAIVAIKGLGGFHLACDARNAAAVTALRERKNREQKPFALMAANVASIAPWADVGAEAAGMVASRERPVVVLPASAAGRALAGVAPGMDTLGFMLPTTPIHFLLFHEAAGRPLGIGWLDRAQDLLLVMTSANPGGEPIVRDNAEARARLAGIADAILDHDRDVVARCDDSVILASGEGARLVRRGRGYAPSAIRLAASGPPVLAFGAHLKNAICVTRGDEAFFSPHVGDLDSAATCGFLDETVTRMLELLEVSPARIAHDLHPDYYSSRAAAEFARRLGLPIVAVQHHHAHVAAVCAEHGFDGPVLGLALDGVGLGSDGAAWGGELLRVDGAEFERLGHLRPLALPGGDRAAREPWRMAAAALHDLGRGEEITSRFDDPAAATVATMLARGLNSPPTSSMGRLFDAVAGLLGICPRAGYEAQAAIMVEQAAARHIAAHGWPAPLADGWALDASGVLDLRRVLAEVASAQDVELAAARFHATLASALGEWVAQGAAAQGLRIVACGGGCFFNSLLATALRWDLEGRGLRVLMPRLASAGDGGIALGQAWVASRTKGL